MNLKKIKYYLDIIAMDKNKNVFVTMYLQQTTENKMLMFDRVLLKLCNDACWSRRDCHVQNKNEKLWRGIDSNDRRTD